MLTELKREAYEANIELPRHGLVALNFGNASALDRRRGIVAIKPSGVDYGRLRPSDMVLVDLDGKRVEGSLRPSSDTPTHLALYRAFPGIGGVVHTHSLYATAWAQARRPIPVCGTTHADYWRGEVPCTRDLRPKEIKTDYEANTGRVIVEAFRRLDPHQRPAVLVAGHGPFAWGTDVNEAVHNAVVLEFVARLALETLRLNPRARQLPAVAIAKHFLRKHGPGAYYGQRSS